MAVNVSKIPNNNKFDPVREAILDLQGQLDDTGGSIGNGTLTVSTSGTLTGSGTFTANQSDNTTITIGIDDSNYLTSADLSDYLSLSDTGEQTIAGDIVISGDLTVSGTTTYINTTHLNIGDNIITLNADLPSDTAPSENAGIEINRGSSTGVDFLWNEADDRWDLQARTGLRVYRGGIGSTTLTIEAGSTAGDAIIALTPNTTGLGGVIRTTNERPIAFQPNNTTKVFIASDGNMNVYEKLAVGKTTAASTYPLEVNGAVLAQNFKAQMTASGNTYTGTVDQYFGSMQIRTDAGGTISLGGSGTGSVQNNVFIKDGDLDVNGDVTADFFIGDGSLLTNLPGGSLDLQDVTDNGNTTTNSISIGKSTAPTVRLDVEGGGSDSVLAKFKSTNTGTGGYAEAHFENDAGDKLVLGSIGSAYNGSAYANSAYIYDIGQDRLSIKASNNLEFFSGGTSLAERRVIIDSSGDISATGILTVSKRIDATKTAKDAYALHLRGGFYGAPRLQLYDLGVDSNAYVGLGVDMSGGAYEMNAYFPRYNGNGRFSIGSWAGDFGTGQYVSGYNEKLFITESASQINVPLTVTGSLRAGSSTYDATPNNEAFNNTLAAPSGTNSRVVNFDGNGTNPSVWWSNGNKAVGAIDGYSGTEGLSFWANNSSSSWYRNFYITSTSATFERQTQFDDRVNISGNLGIGFTSAPSAKLQVYSSSENTRFDSADANGPYLSFRNSGVAKGYIGSAYHLWVSPNNSADNFGIRAENRLDLGVGTTPTLTINSNRVTQITREAITFNGTVQTLLVDGGTGNGALTINSASSYAYQTFAQGGTGKFEMGIVGTAGAAYGDFYLNKNIQQGQSGSAFYIKRTNDFIGIGTTSPSNKLSVEGGSIKLNHDNAAANYYLELNKKEGQDGGLILKRDNANDWQVVNVGTSGDLWFYSYGTSSSAFTIKRSDGNVGIGTTTPSAKLHTTGKTLSITTSSSWGQSAVANTNDAEVGFVWAAGGSGYPGITSTYTRQWIAGLSPFGTGTDRWSLTNRSLGSNTAITVLENGYIGFGTTAPSTRLQVNGDTRITSNQLHIDSPNAAYINLDASGANWSYVSLQKDDVTIWDIAQYNGGNLEFRPYGGGTNSIYFTHSGQGYFEQLELKGSSHKYLYINPGNGYEAMVRYNGGSGSTWYVGKRTSSDVVGTESFHFYSQAAGQTVAGIDTAGNGRFRGDVVAYYSDMRLKNKIGDIENPIAKVQALNGFYYEPNEIAQSYGYEKERRIGLSAQDVKEVVPEAIHDAPVGDGYMSVDYAKLVPVLVEAIKEQQKQIDELKARLDA